MKIVSVAYGGVLALGFAGSVMGIAGTANAAELITNGTFSAGATGYLTQYTGTDATGTQYITTNPNSVCGCFASNDGTANGHGNQLVLDGAANGDYFFQETVNIVAGTRYTLSFDAANLGSAGPIPNVAALINGVQVLSTGDLSYNDTYQTYTFTFDAGSATSATITLFDQTLTHEFNDFAIDNVSFTGAAATVAAVPEPASWAMMISGFGLVGASMRRKRANVRFA